MFRSCSDTSKYFLTDYVTMAMLIFLVTMATPASSRKNSTFTAHDEDTFFRKRKNPGMSLVFI